MPGDPVDEFVLRSRELNGRELVEREQWNTVADRDAIRHFAYGIGDDNPLWIEPAHAQQAGYERLPAPPAFVASVLYPALHGAPMDVALSSVISELDCRWYQRIFEGDRLRAEARQVDVRESRSRHGHRIVDIVSEISYRNQHGERVAGIRSVLSRIARGGDGMLSERSVVPRDCAGESGWVPLGRPVDGVELELLDESGRPAALGEVGEIVIGGARVARGYLSMAEETDRCFVHGAGDRGGDGLRFRTGDLASRRPDGVLEPRGRADDRVKVRGNRVELGEVEAVLSAHPGIRDAAVRSYSGAGGEVRLVAYMVPSGHSDIGADEVRGFLAERLPAYMVPSVFLTVESLPRTPSGKLDRSGLPPPPTTRPAAGADGAEPRNEIERSIAEIWKDALDVDSVGIRESFISLGGHSLSAMRVVSRLYETFGLDVSVRELFDAADVARLSELVAHRLRAGPPASAGDGAAD
jgi:acyl dehydratase/acyl carrier protein